MSFSTEWLALREAADARAREASTAAFLDRLAGSGLGELVACDLGGGSGNNVRHLAPRIAAHCQGIRQRWTLIDGDAALLAAARERLAGLPITLETRSADFAAADLADLCGDADLVTLSALLDLASAAWLADLARAVRRARWCLAVLSVDGRVEWQPPHRADASAVRAFEADMGRDKGLGEALGAEAPSVFGDALAQEGFEVEAFDATWRLGEADRALQGAYLEGVEGALQASGGWVADWAEARRAAIGAGRGRLSVGHIDLLATRDAAEG